MLDVCIFFMKNVYVYMLNYVLNFLWLSFSKCFFLGLSRVENEPRSFSEASSRGGSMSESKKPVLCAASFALAPIEDDKTHRVFVPICTESTQFKRDGFAEFPA